MSTPLLETKLYLPRPRHGLVPRPRLQDRLHRGLSSRLMLVSAPAGFGKTTLLVDWMAAVSADRRARPRAAWLSLDADDNDPARFWTYVIAALRTAVPGIGADALGLLQESQPPPAQVVLTTLLNDLGGADVDVVLVLDDYHVIDSPDVQAGMAFLLEHLPPRLHLVIASRADPALPLAAAAGPGRPRRDPGHRPALHPRRGRLLPQRGHGPAAHPGRRGGPGGAHRGLDRRAPARRAVDGRTGRHRLASSPVSRATTATSSTTSSRRSCNASRTTSRRSCCRPPSSTG